MDKITKNAYAKVNLALEVLDEFEGYHKVNNLMIKIDLYDTLKFTKRNDNIINFPNNPFPNNIILKAIDLFYKEYNITNGLDIELIKNIPSEAGLAGGSSDGAVTLLMLNELFEVNASEEKLKDLASKLGSDVPFFISSNLALCTNRGEVINDIDIDVKPINILLIKIKEGLSTKEVYKNYIYQNIERVNNFNNIYQALKTNDLDLLNNSIFNDLTTPALKLSTKLNDLYNKLNTIYKTHLSGSGPTMYMINPKEDVINKVRSIVDKDTLVIEVTTTK